MVLIFDRVLNILIIPVILVKTEKKKQIHDSKIYSCKIEVIAVMNNNEIAPEKSFLIMLSPPLNVIGLMVNEKIRWINGFT